MKYPAKVVSCFLVVNLLGACSGNANQNTDKSNTDKETEKTTVVEKSENSKTTNSTGNINPTGTTNPNAETENPKDVQSAIENESKNESVLTSIRKQLKTDLPVLVPNELPIENGKYLTAKTTSSNNQYTIVYYQTDKNTPVNDKTLEQAPKDSVIAKYEVKKYSNEKEANDVIGFEDFSKTGGQKVSLGHNITGYQDAAAGSQFTGWNEGRWAIATQTRTANPEKGLVLAKQAVEFLEKNTLPIPKPNGSIHLSATSSTGNMVKWQNNTIVYSIENVKDPMEALRIATSVK